VVSLGFGRSFTGGFRSLAEFVAYGSAVLVKTG
jgi:hypothetical protein